ncbi:HNH endonuclease [Cytobacillus firmus]|uniref:HNH endonuclease n=1 Tax=Cytobacillus firmus TaxID=1399 RepID=UPI0024C0EAD7|nr:HNH endonuclease [Cytobacillus firmus]WHY63655.1 HNH endonuclease [Cytobacillus firmus]
MNFFLVFQNKSYREEKSGGYLWAPQKNEKGQTFHHWTDMKNVKKGDIIFNSYDTEMHSVLVAKEDCIERERPSDLDDLKLWHKNGWMILVEYIDLVRPFKYKDYMEDILKLQGERYAPFNKIGRGNTGYLFRVSRELAEYLFQILEDTNGITKTSLVQANIQKDIEIIEDLEKELKSTFTLEQTEKELIVKSRIGQTLFKKALLKQENRCRLCGVTDERFLVASHIKQWSQSNNEERLDVNNGLLLCPNHDSLFDKGYVSFNDNGEILTSKSLDNDLKVFLNINDKMKIRMNENQKQYMEWHRENKFKN